MIYNESDLQWILIMYNLKLLVTPQGRQVLSQKEGIRWVHTPILVVIPIYAFVNTESVLDVEPYCFCVGGLNVEAEKLDGWVVQAVCLDPV